MGILDILAGRQAPSLGMARRDAEDLRFALLDLNRATAPFLVRDGTPEGAHLVSEWRVMEPRWHGVFARAGLGRAGQVLLRIDDEQGEVRAAARDWAVAWQAGAPLLSPAPEGSCQEPAPGPAWREQGHPSGRTPEWRFATRELKRPLHVVVTTSGWAWRPVPFERL